MSRYRILATTLLFAASASGCGELEVERGDRAIINGEVVADDDLPTVGGIATNAGTVCTGTLISPTAVLTAAHCVEPNLIKQGVEQGGGTPPDEIVYRFSFARDLVAAGDGDFLEVSSVEWHEQFLMDTTGLFERPGRWHDIAVMHLAEPVADRPVQALAPADVVEALEMGRSHLVTGYGLTDDADPMSAGVLTQGMSNLDERGANELIAGVDDPQQACRGDSGGPIFADDGATYQIGIASRINADLFPPPQGAPPCETGLLYTRVDTYLEWISERVSDLEDPTNPDDPSDPNDPDDPNDPNDPNDPGTGDGDPETGGCSAGGSGAELLFVALALAAMIATRRRRGWM